MRLLFSLVCLFFTGNILAQKQTITIAPTVIDCNNLNPKKCLQYKVNDKENWKVLPYSIKGFQYEINYLYKLKVKLNKNKQYELIKIINKKYIAPTTTTYAKGLPLSSQWILEKINIEMGDNIPIQKRSYITIDEKQNRFYGNGGCNSLGGEFSVTGNKISFSKIYRTEIFCNDISSQEDIFCKLLETANHYKIIGAELFLYNDDTLILTLESYRN